MLTSLAKKRLDIPNEVGEWIEIRMLSGKQLDDARAAKVQTSLEMGKAMGAEVAAVIDAARAQLAEQPVNTAEPDPLDSLDAEIVLRSGIVSWSYKVRVTPANIDDLDEAMRTWAVREIIAHTVESESARLKN